MAEFYVYYGSHWLAMPGELAKQQQKINDKLIPYSKKKKMLSILQKKHDVRYVEGDIVEAIKGKGLYDEKAKRWNGDCHTKNMVLIHVEGLKLKDALAYEVAHEDGDNILHRRWFKINLNALSVKQKQELTEHGHTSITLLQFNSNKVDKGV